MKRRTALSATRLRSASRRCAPRPVARLAGLLALALTLTQVTGPREVAAGAAEDDLRLVPAESTIRFVGIKNNSAAVPGGFGDLRGGASSSSGSAWIEVTLSSLETGDPERDKNILTHFFQADSFPLARFEVRELPSSLAEMPVGSSQEIEIAGTLKLHGAEAELRAWVRITREDVGYRLETTRAIVIDAVALGMTRQVATLKAVCGHLALDSVFPVDVSLLFTR